MPSAGAITTEQKVTRPAAAWIAVPLCLLNILMSVVSVFLAFMNDSTAEDVIGFIGVAILVTSFSLVGGFVAARRPANPLGWIFLAVGFSEGLVSFAFQYAYYVLITHPGILPGGPLMSILGQIAWLPGLQLLLTYALLLYPTGRLPSPGWRVVAWVSAIPLLLFPIGIAGLWPYQGRAVLENPDIPNQTGGIWVLIYNLPWFPLMILTGLASVLSLIVRYRRAQGVERLQIRWFAFAAIVTVITIALTNFFYEALYPATVIMQWIAAPLMPAAAGIAILRYRLWEIDVIIRHTLVYGVLTAILALLYFGSIVLLQAILQRFSSQVGQSPLAIVLSTLAIAALFAPLRKRIQQAADRRFYRRRYDAEQTLQAFAARLRNEVDLEQISRELLNVVDANLQPDHVSLWLKKPEEKERQLYSFDAKQAGAQKENEFLT